MYIHNLAEGERLLIQLLREGGPARERVAFAASSQAAMGAAASAGASSNGRSTVNHILKRARGCINIRMPELSSPFS